MTEIIVPDHRRLVWYLAAEEYLAQRVKEDTVFFWVVSPTVIFGRHQVMHNEVNIPYCRQHNISMYRRKSGGGCVYADQGNLMVSYISPSSHSQEVFDRYLSFMSQALRDIGYPAVVTTNNDILVEERKVSGNACFALPQSTIVHGTMLWDVDMDQLTQAITPPADKLLKHGIQSVRQRVKNLATIELASDKPRLESITMFKAALASQLCPKAESLHNDDIEQIDLIEQTYLDPDFLNDNI